MGRMRDLAKQKEIAVATPTGNSLVASAVRMNAGSMGDRRYRESKRDAAWQDDGWFFYDRVGEYRYVCDLVGSMLSKAVLVAMRRNGGKMETVKTGPAMEILDSLFATEDERQEALRQIGIHFTVAGECWIVAHDNLDPFATNEEVWRVVSSRSLTRMGTTDEPKYLIDSEPVMDTAGNVIPDKDLLIIRLWRPHPRFPERANSPTKAALPVLREIHKLTQHVDAQIDSRLVSAGIILISNEIQVPPPPVDPNSEDPTAPTPIASANTAEDLMRVLIEVASQAIEDRSSASALVPIVISAPTDAIDKIKHMTFWSGLDESAIEMRKEGIQRLALAMDIPPEILLGVADSNHWAAWNVDESAIKAHTEPLLKIITNGLSSGYLRPLLADANMPLDEVRQYSIQADTSEMRLRPNRSKEAFELYDRGELSGKALLRETGFDPDDDAMDDAERQQWITRTVASGSATPEMVVAALRILGVDLGPITAPGEEGPMREKRPTPSLEEHPEQELPDPEVTEPDAERKRRDRAEGSPYSALMEGCNQLVIRALERAGNRMKQGLRGKPTVSAFQMHTVIHPEAERHDFLLEDAWTHVPDLAQRTGQNPADLTAILDGYARHIIDSAQPHSFASLEDWMEKKLLAHEMEAMA